MLLNSEFLPSEKEFFEFLKIRFATVGIDFDEIKQYLLASLEISEKRFLLTKSKYLTNESGKIAQFRATHYSSHSLILYQLARECFLKDRRDMAEKIYFLNTSTTSTDLFYEVDLPLRTGCDHPLGSVIGRAIFEKSSSLFFCQNCNIGNNIDSNGLAVYPDVSGNLYMNPRSMIIGRCIIRGTVVLANGAYVKDHGVLENVVVFGASPNLILKPITEFRSYQSSVFHR
jgi:serine O-acetyltransferase